MISRFLNEEDGQTLVEYGLLISLLALVVVAAVAYFGQRMQQFYNSAANKMPNS